MAISAPRENNVLRVPSTVAYGIGEKVIRHENNASAMQNNVLNRITKMAPPERLIWKKETDKIYFRHSGYPGGFKKESLSQIREKAPLRILELAVKRMLPANRLRSQRMNRLKLVVGDKNPYEHVFLSKEEKTNGKK